MLDNKILHDCGARQWLQCARPDCHYVHTPTSPSLSPTSKAATGAAPEVSKPQLDFFEDCSVVDLAQKINLNLSGIVKSIQKSLLKEPTTDHVLKEATKTAHKPKTHRRKEQLLAKLDLLKKENALRHQLISQHAALARAKHALQLRRRRTKLYTVHQFRLGSVLSSHQPFIDDALAEVTRRRQQQASAAASVSHLHLVNTVAKLAPAGKYINPRPVPLPTPIPEPLPPSNRSLWRQQHNPSWTPAPFPFKLESFSAPKTRVVHVHHHHYQDSVVDSEDFSDDESVVEDEYIEDEYYDEGDYYEEEDNFYGEEEDECFDSEFSSEEESHFACTTSCDEDSSLCSGYDESSY